METEEYYGGTYPSPPEPKQKNYEITCEIYGKAKIYVIAESVEEAEEKCKRKDYEDYEILNMEIDEFIGNKEIE